MESTAPFILSQLQKVENIPVLWYLTKIVKLGQIYGAYLKLSNVGHIYNAYIKRARIEKNRVPTIKGHKYSI